MAAKHTWLKRIAAALVILAAILAVALGVYVSDYSRAGSEAEAIIAVDSASDASVAVADFDAFIAVGDENSEYGIVFYPGGKVAPEAYAPLAAKFAEQGVFCVIAKMPFNLAFLNLNAADSAISAYSGVSHWWIGGHSLGGVAAASYAASHTSKLEGLALLAAYSTEDLSQLGLKAELVYGSNDGVVSRERLDACIAQLPADSVLQIAGGNHAGFGDYGAQSGDNEATILPDEQQAQAVAAIVAAMR
ncbi:alpha/beta hydrolase [Paratractidigestivibacter sp.]|uniref:alpha/beta hydrolase n=1 Tax=Paratractidigestivibacter sp. TaxID=2847316 RepID=UPI002AC89F78|nr:alpha/beta hydrolase [Paratractidigestivibacter sp.]